jgi:hypothetical protein
MSLFLVTPKVTSRSEQQSAPALSPPGTLPKAVRLSVKGDTKNPKFGNDECGSRNQQPSLIHKHVVKHIVSAGGLCNPPSSCASSVILALLLVPVCCSIHGDPPAGCATMGCAMGKRNSRFGILDKPLCVVSRVEGKVRAKRERQEKLLPACQQSAVIMSAASDSFTNKGFPWWPHAHGQEKRREMRL